MINNTKPNRSFWLISVFTILWYSFGMIEFINQVLLTHDAQIANRIDSENIIDLIPLWVKIVFSIATFSGLAAAILLTLRKKIAFYLFAISSCCLVLQYTYNYTDDSITFYGPNDVVLPYVILTFNALILLYTVICTKKGWLK